MSDPNQKLAETQATIARAVADLHAHSHLVGRLVGEQLTDGVVDDLAHSLDVANARIRVLEGQQGNVLVAVVNRLFDRLNPHIVDRNARAERFRPGGTMRAYHRGYAQALTDFLDGKLTVR